MQTEAGTGNIQRRNASFGVTQQCTSEAGKNITNRIEMFGKDVLDVARATPRMPSCVVRALELGGSAVAAPVSRKVTSALAIIAAAGCYATMTGTYQAASLRETLLQHVEGLFVAIEQMDKSAALGQWETLKRNYFTFNQARNAENRFFLHELAMALYHAACMALQIKAHGCDLFDHNLVKIHEELHAFIATRWPQTAGRLSVQVAL